MHHFLNFWRNALQHGQDDVDLVLAETEDNKERLQRDLENRFTNEGSPKENTEGDQEMPTEEACQIEQGVWNL